MKHRLEYWNRFFLDKNVFLQTNLSEAAKPIKTVVSGKVEVEKIIRKLFYELNKL